MDSIILAQRYIDAGALTVINWVVVMAAITLAAIVVLAKSRSTGLFDFISNNILVISITIWFMGVVLYMLGLHNACLNWLYVIPSAIISAFKMFLVMHDYSRVQPVLQKDVLYMSVFSLVHLCAAFISFLFLFKVVGFKVKSALNLKLFRLFQPKQAVVHLFWDINELSYLMAEDIKRNGPDDVVVFVDIEEEDGDLASKKANMSHIVNSMNVSKDDIRRLDNIGALVDHCYNGPAALGEQECKDVFKALRLPDIGKIVKKARCCNFYFLSEDESVNIAGALNLKRDGRLMAKGKDEAVIYLHARKDIDIEVYGHYSQFEYSKEGPKMKIVDSAYLSIAGLKRGKKTLPVKCVDVDPETGTVDAPFTSLIVGFGSTGKEAFKFLYEFSAFIDKQKNRVPFKCYAVDENIGKIAGLVRGRMPAIGADELELVQASVDSDDFWKLLGEIVARLNYVVIAMNNDNQGLALAVNIYSYALQHRPKGLPGLKIMVRCYDSANERRMAEITTSLNDSVEGDAVEMLLFGMQKDIYNCELVLSDSIMCDAMEFNAAYENNPHSAKEQWNANFGAMELKKMVFGKGLPKYHAIADINRRVEQNVSNSMHMSTKMHLLGLYGSSNPDELKKFAEIVATRENGKISYVCGAKEAELLLNCAIVEHERWLASHKLMGYVFGETKDYVKKMHNCIVPWNDLSEETQSYDCNVVDTTLRLAYKNLCS